MNAEKKVLFQIIYYGYKHLKSNYSRVQEKAGGDLTIGNKVKAIGKSSTGAYEVGDIGVIVSFNQFGHPNIKWDKDGKIRTANKDKVEIYFAQKTKAGGDLTIGNKVKAIGKSSTGAYKVGDTGVIVDFNQHGHPNIKWDKDGEIRTANLQKVKLEDEYEGDEEVIPHTIGNNIKILDMTSTSQNIRSWNPITFPAGTIFFRSASAKPDGIPGATKYNQTDDPRFYGDLDTAARYMGEGKEMYMVMFDNMVLADISCLATQVYIAYNEELKKKLDQYLRSDFGNATRATQGTLVNPHNLLITKKNEALKGVNNRSTQRYQDFGNIIKTSESYEGTEDRIKFLAFFITYGVCPVNQLEIAINAYNFEVQQFKAKYGDEKKIGQRDVNEVDQNWLQDWAGLNDLMLSDIACQNMRKDPPPGNLSGLSYRLSIGVLDDMACDFLKSYATRFGIDGYYSFKQYVPWGPNREHGRTEKFQFHSEICVFTPKEKIMSAVPLTYYARNTSDDPMFPRLNIPAEIDRRIWEETFKNSYVANKEMQKFFADALNIKKIFTTVNNIIKSDRNSSDVKESRPRELKDTRVYTRIQDKIKGQPQRFGGKSLKKAKKLSTKNKKKKNNKNNKNNKITKRKKN